MVFVKVGWRITEVLHAISNILVDLLLSKDVLFALVSIGLRDHVGDAVTDRHGRLFDLLGAVVLKLYKRAASYMYPIAVECIARTMIFEKTSQRA